MTDSPYLPLLTLTRGETIESIHFGAISVVDVRGNLVAWYGNPQAVTYLRSTAKPIQALPFLAQGGQKTFNLTSRELALMCASHSGTNEHVNVIQSFQLKTGTSESDLLCGIHPPLHKPTAEDLRQRGEKATPNRHNCSGKHTGMLAFAHMRNLPTEDYINPDHPIQLSILQTFAEMCGLPAEKVALGIDGCSAPNFAVPLYNAAWAYARLCDPNNGNVQPPALSTACQMVTTAMTSHPELVAGPDRFDTQLMDVTQGNILSKGGAEGFQGLGLLPGTLGPGSPALGVAMKISDGDLKGRVRSAVSIEVLRQLSALSRDEIKALAKYGPSLPVYNWRKIVVGHASPCFELERET